MSDDSPDEDEEEESEIAQQSLDLADVRDYHESIAEAVDPLGALGDHPTLLVNDKMGWYVTRDNENPDEGSDDTIYPKERRPRRFSEDYTEVVDNRLERTLYSLTSYKRPEVFNEWEPAYFDDDDGKYVYHDQKPTPTVEDLTAISVWGDIDLADELKPQRPDLDDETYDTAERAYAAYIDAFSELYGGHDAVYMLDSVGGAYIFGAPEATLPISRYYEDDPEARAWVFDELIERSNDYLHDAEATINEEIDRASEVIDPDWANNINRQYKTPLTLHGDHDAVVTPVDVGDIHYREPTPVEDVTDDLTDRVQQWCTEFTASEHEDRVGELVESLWPDKYEEHGSWAGALDAWVESQRKQARREEQRRQAAAERRAERIEELEEGIEGTPITPFLQDVYDALDGIDTAEVVRHYASDEWDSGADMADKTEFNPSWRASKSGASCYVNHSTNRFGDPGDSGGGYAAKAMALGKGIITSASDDLIGEEWGEAVEALRDAGYDVPIWTPEKGSRRHDGSAYEKMPFWAVKKAAIALGVVPEDSLVEKSPEDGSTYLGFPGNDSYSSALDAVEEAGLEHGRSRSQANEASWVSDPATEVSLEPRNEVALSDAELLEKAQRAGNGEKFTALWEGDISDYETPAQADMAFCYLLAFWTGGDGEWMDRLYRQSGSMRERWDEQIGSSEEEMEADLTYGDSTIRHALAQNEEFYESVADTTSDDSPADHAENTDNTGRTDPETAEPTAEADTPTDNEPATGPDPEQHAQLKAEVESLREELEEREARVEHLESGQMVRKNTIEHLREEIDELESENENLRDRIDELKARNPADGQQGTPTAEEAKLDGKESTADDSQESSSPAANHQSSDSDSDSDSGSPLSNIRDLF